MWLVGRTHHLQLRSGRMSMFRPPCWCIPGGPKVSIPDTAPIPPGPSNPYRILHIPNKGYHFQTENAEKYINLYSILIDQLGWNFSGIGLSS